VSVPAFVTTEALDTRVKERRRRAAKPAAKSSEPSATQKKAEAMRKARYAWRDAMEQRGVEINARLVERARATPGLAACVVLFGELIPPQKDDPLKTPWYRDLIRRLATPSLETVLAIEARFGDERLLNPWQDGPSGFADAVAQALGIEMGPAPKVEDFLPRAEPPAKATPAKKKPAKKGAGS